MGCDIHMVLERKFEGKWVGLHAFPFHTSGLAKDDRTRPEWASWPGRSRNYVRFGALANVRGEGPDPRGVPDDASDLARLEIDGWGDDGHSHSWLPLREAVEIFLATEKDPATVFLTDDWRSKRPLDYFFSCDAEGDQLDEFRIVFWFDN